MNLSIKILLPIVLLLGLFHSSALSQPQQPTGESTISNTEETTKKFIKDLKHFVRSVNKENYQPDSYWQEVDQLWEALQSRKERLTEKFNDRQQEQVRKLEQKYQTIRTKKTKLS